jgi:molybdate transport system permease protein
VQAVVALPLVLPPTVLGFYLLVALGPLTAPGRLIIRLLGHPLAFSFSGLVVGSVLYSLPFAVQPLVAGFRAVDRSHLESAAGLGLRPAGVFTSIVLPLAKNSVLASAILTFTHTVGEFGVVLMLGGKVQDFNYAAANRTALLLLAVSIAALLTIYGRAGERDSNSLGVR